MSNGKLLLVTNKFNKCTKLAGDEWILAIIEVLSKNELRFCEILRAVPNLNPSTLTNRLKKLEDQEIIERKEETLNKLSVVYSLTPKGQEFLPVLTQIKMYANKYF